jgi:beta-galactosidase
MTIGVCYFPEHWPRERWRTDVEGMAAAGIEYVRMAEFSWGRLEPERGSFDFEWLDVAVDLLAEHGMDVVLCTPTATPPKWLVDERPGIRQEEPDGTVRAFGSRRHYCFNSPAYREETERIVTRMADRYASRSAVAGWQTDNEYGCHGTVRCYCDDCAEAFREWLEDRYGTIRALNEAWGTGFWSQQHGSFEEIDPPRHTVAEHHPSRSIDYDRFASDSVVSYNRLQTDLLRERNDGWFLTHNFMGDFETLDAYAVSGDLDLVSWDSYPTGFVQDRRTGEATADELRAGDPDQVGLNHDLYRGVLGRPFWVMEQQPGDVNWPPYTPQPAQGAMRLWAHHAVAHGADVVSYFRWRRCRFGQEQYHAGLRRQDGSPDRGYQEAARAAEEFDGIDDLGPVDAPVALLHDYEDWWAIDAQPHAPDFDYWEHLRTYYRAIRARGVQVDVVHPSTSLEGYDAVIVPLLHLVTAELAARLEDYASSGGELLVGARSGAKDRHNKLWNDPAPGPLSSLLGIAVDQHESLPEPIETRVSYGEGEYEFLTWAEWLALEGAEALGTHRSGVGEGRPAIARNAVGDGHATYCGVWPGLDLADALVTDVLDAAGVPHTDRLPDGVRVSERDGRTWITNFTGDRVRAMVDGEWVLGDGAIGTFDLGVVRARASDVSVEMDAR